MRILFFDISFHRHTRSSYFFSDLLEGRGEVVRLWDERWEGGPAADPTPWENGSVDVAVFWQLLLPPAELLQLQYRSLVWVPMWDALHNVPDVALRPYLIAKPRVLCFCRVLYERLSGLGFNCLYTKYFPALPEEPVRAREGISVFFSQRRNAPNWETVKRLLGDEMPHRIFIKNAMDPGCRWYSPAPEEIRRYNVSIIDGWMDQTAYYDLLRSCTVFIAPRRREGIGLSLLDAMSLGMCVVSGDEATANEYIVSGTNGLLYPPEAPRAIDLSMAATLGEVSRETVRQGRKAWIENIDRVMSFVFGEG